MKSNYSTRFNLVILLLLLLGYLFTFPKLFNRFVYSTCTEDSGGCGGSGFGNPPPINPDPNDPECNGTTCNGGGTGGLALYTMYLCTDPKPLTANGKIKQQCDTNSYDSFPSPCYTGWGTWAGVGGTCHYANDPCMLQNFGSSPGKCGGITDKNQLDGVCNAGSKGECDNKSPGGPGWCGWSGTASSGSCDHYINLCQGPTGEQDCWGQVGDGGQMNCYWYCPNGKYVAPNNPPTGTLTCPSSPVNTGQTVNFTLNGRDTDNDLQKARLYYSPNPPTNPSGDWTQIGGDIPCSGGSCTPSTSWTPSAGGTYTIAANYYDSQSAQCSGNPFISTWPSSGFSACAATPTPVNSTDSCTITVIPKYQNVTVTGTLHSQTGKGASAQCTAYSGNSTNTTISLTTTHSDVIHPTCTVSGSTYTCTITYDNSDPSLATQDFGLTAASTTNGMGTWHTKDTGNQCTSSVATTLSITADPNSTKSYDNTSANTDIFFHVDPWMKAKDTSLNTQGLSFNSIPPGALAFDTDDPGNPVLIDGEAGLVTSTNNLPAGLRLSSPNQWSISGYQKVTGFNFDSFYAYIQSRKQYKVLSSLSSDLHEINEDATDHIFYFDASDSPLTITSAPTSTAVLLVKGSVVISNNLTSTGFALITNGTITVAPSVNSLQGIYISSAFDTGSSPNGLKIKGNLVTSSTTNGRDLTNNLKPSVFVDFDAGQYMNLLPYLSIAKYDQTIK